MESLRTLAGAAGSLLVLLSVAHAADKPAWFPPSYRQALHAPLPAGFVLGATPATIDQFEVFPDLLGLTGNVLANGPVRTTENAFFAQLGTNGRSCLTCHQPSQAMSVGKGYIRVLYVTSKGRDPLFAPVDGAHCPNQTLGRAAHSLLLDRGLFRIFLPVPQDADFTIEVVSDPNGCNADPAYNSDVDPVTGQTRQIVSVYRRPLITSNLRFKTTTIANLPGGGTGPGGPGGGVPIDLETGRVLQIDPFTGQFESLHIMWDSREHTLQSQASNAVMIHSQATTPPTDEQVAQMVAFQNSVSTAQESLGLVSLSRTAQGGARALGAREPTFSLGVPAPVFTEYDAWAGIATPTTPSEELKASVARGQDLFNNFDFTFVIGNKRGQRCSSCHGQIGAGSESNAGAAQNTGIGGQSAAVSGPAPDPALPIFKITCAPTAPPADDGAVVLTNDPALALITGRCRDVGASVVPTIRGLAARAPYFRDGSANTVRDIVEFYDKRFTIGFTEQQKQDLTNFLTAL